MKTGFNKQSELPPSAYSVEEPSNDHIGTSFRSPLKFLTTNVFPRKD